MANACATPNVRSSIIVAHAKVQTLVQLDVHRCGRLYAYPRNCCSCRWLHVVSHQTSQCSQSTVEIPCADELPTECIELHAAYICDISKRQHA